MTMSTSGILLICGAWLVSSILAGVLGYVLGWHRGSLRLPLGFSGRPKRSAASPPAPKIVEEIRTKAPEVRTYVEQRYPNLTGQQTDQAVEEILLRGHQLRGKLATRLDSSSSGS